MLCYAASPQSLPSVALPVSPTIRQAPVPSSVLLSVDRLTSPQSLYQSISLRSLSLQGVRASTDGGTGGVKGVGLMAAPGDPHGVPCGPMVSHGVPWDTMVSHVIPVGPSGTHWAKSVYIFLSGLVVGGLVCSPVGSHIDPHIVRTADHQCFCFAMLCHNSV